MSILFAVVGGILLILVHALIEIPIIWVGEIVLFIVSFGRHKPRWDCYTYERGSDFAFLSETSFWIVLSRYVE